MCDSCFDISDFVCFLTFFITAIVSLLFVQHFFIYVDFETEEKIRSAYLWRSVYLFTLTVLGCLVFAGVQRRSIHLLKWPSRLLVLLITVGLAYLSFLLWTLDRVQGMSVRDLELKLLKLSLVVVLAMVYLVGVQRLVNLLDYGRSTHRQQQFNIVLRRRSSVPHNHNSLAQSSSTSSTSPVNLVDIFRSKRLKKTDEEEGVPIRQFNADRNGINYYKLLLEGNGEGRYLNNNTNSSSSYSLRSLPAGNGTNSIVTITTAKFDINGDVGKDIFV